MAQRGRTPKPTALKKLEGNQGHRPLNEREPKPPKKALACPKDLSKEAKKEWRRLCREMEQEGVLYGEGELTRQHLTQMIRNRVESSRVAEWFKPGRWQLFNECAILSIDSESGRVAKRRPDRVMTDGEQTIVVDFKFGRDRSEYHEQVKQYMALLRDMGHKNVKGYLWLVYKNEIIEV